MKKLLKLLLVSVFLINSVSITVYTQKTEPAVFASDSYKLQDLIDNFKKYTTTNVRFHAGDLYQHSIWTALIVDQWFENHEFWSNGLSAHDRELAVLAALLHDIGKAGDLDFVFYTKPGHEIEGLKYLLGKKSFYLTHNKTIDFAEFFANLGLSEDEIKIIAILVGCHNQLGMLLSKLPQKTNNLDKLSRSKPAIYDFFANIYKVLVWADYEKKLDSRLLKLITLVCAADVKGSRKVDLNKPLKIFDFTITSSPDIAHPKCLDNFTKFGYDSRGKKICKFLLGLEK